MSRTPGSRRNRGDAPAGGRAGRSQAILAALTTVAVCAGLGVVFPPAAFGEQGLNAGGVTAYSATVRVEDDGTLHVAEAVTYDFAGSARSTVSRSITTREQFDADTDRIYTLSDVTADAVQTDVDATVTSEDERAVVEVNFSEPQADQVTVTFDYRVDGTVAETPDGLEVRWPVVQGYDVPIASATVRWDVRDATWLSCLAGAPGSSRPCTSSQLVDVSAPTMTELDLGAGDEMVGILGLGTDSGVSASTDLQPRWSLSRAFSATGTPLIVALVVLALGLLAALALWLARGRDRRAGETAGVSPLVEEDGRALFAPPSGVRPGQMGTVVDEHADVVDVASTILDLAVRNYLFVEELSNGPLSGRDWMLRRRNSPGDELLPYEREVFDAIFAESDAVSVSALAETLRPRLPVVQALLYGDMVQQGWFVERPDAVRSRWTTAGWVLVAAGVVLTVVLALVSTFGLVGLAVILAGVALAASGQVAPARTSRGSRLLTQLREFRDFLAAAEVRPVAPEQRAEIVSRCFPYAVVFGLTDRWAAALAATDPDDEPDEPVYWYGGREDWHLNRAAPALVDLAAALNASIAPRRLLAVD